jgi:C4-dicarboxylate-specific signal transduction histidine kinase
MSNPSEIERLRRQQGALADFGSFAFREDNLQAVLAEAARICAQGLNVPFAKICRYRPKDGDLLVVAGWGWHSGVVGGVVSKADKSSTQGRAFVTGEPVILENVGKNHSYKLPAFYAEHQVISTADVPIQSKKGSWGVLEVDSAVERQFDQHDIVFLTGFANVVAEAVVTSERTFAMRDSIRRMELMIAEKDQFLIEREEQEKHLRELQSELLHMSRLNALGQMTAAIAHELNQPLAAIANYVGAAKLTLESAGTETKLLNQAQEMLDKAQEQTLRAGKVIGKLREMVEKREHTRVAENLEAIVRGAMAIALFGSAESEILVNISVADAVPAVLIDKVQIQQILFNLIRNSIEAMSDSESRKLDISISLDDPGFVDVTVQDTGTGMPSGVVSRLFLPFVTTKSDGMGLGLMICQNLVEANGGRIWRLDHVTAGTAFRFCLPYAIAPIGALPLVA